ncbi:MAG: thioredoxin domain-containing protein [Verrucomicrobiota bacterium]|nr:thioredoxin domain-containing protein [Verrucomicrobiota bacterium]
MTSLRIILTSSAAAALVGCQPGEIPGSNTASPAEANPLTQQQTELVTVDNTQHEEAKPKHTNRLANEASPYLHQHQHNPVDWYPWGEEAFSKARDEQKPILLSIGYSTCHWCHVMERESFEDEATARVMNEHFVNIKLDREERPDVDKIYMTFVQATTGGGGWPLNVWLTPDLKPFFGGTYFPPEAKFGKPSFTDVLKQIADAWKNQKAEILNSANDISQRIGESIALKAKADIQLDPAWLDKAVSQFKTQYDPRFGGFGNAPKFPRPSLPLMLLRHAHRTGDQDAINMVLHTCDQMAAGGMYDQIGGGFARYAVDEKWLVPHFEKMLYDNAQLLHLYLDAHLVSGKQKHAKVAHDILRYILRDMRHKDGGFYSAEDADSEGKEGKFYCWTEAELKSLLTPDEFILIKRRYGITTHGNFEDHSDPEPLKGQNVLSIVDPTLNDNEASQLESATGKMFDVRAKRVRPHLDDKILSSWNGLMLGAIARAGVVLNEPEYLKAAQANLTFLQRELWDAETKTLYHRWREGQRDDIQLLDAYAFLLDGVLHLYEATLESKHLQFAIDLAGTMKAKFYDDTNGGFWQSVHTPNLIMKVKEDYDGAIPSGNSVAVLALLRLGKITDNKTFTELAEKTLLLFSDNMINGPNAVPHLLQALDFLVHEPRRAVITGDPKSIGTLNLIAAAHAAYQPNKVVLGVVGPVESFAKTLPKEGNSSAYLCTGSACQPPTSNALKLQEMMASKTLP